MTNRECRSKHQIRSSDLSFRWDCFGIRTSDFWFLDFGFRISDLPPHIRQFHHVVEMAGGIVAADMEDVELAGVGPGDRLEAADAFKLAFIRAVVIEGGAMNDLHGAPGAHDIPGQPDFAVAAATDAAKEFVVGNDRWCGGGFGNRFRCRGQRAAEVVQQLVAGVGVGIHRTRNVAQVCLRSGSAANAGSLFNWRRVSRSSTRRKAKGLWRAVTR